MVVVVVERAAPHGANFVEEPKIVACVSIDGHLEQRMSAGM